MLKKKCQSQGYLQSALPIEKPKVAVSEGGGTFLSSKRRLKGNALTEFQIWFKIQWPKNYSSFKTESHFSPKC